MSIFFGFNYIDFTMTDRDAWAGGEPSLDNVAI